MENLGFIFGMLGMSTGTFGIIAFSQCAQVRKELADLKRSLRDAGILPDLPPDPKEK